VARQRDVGVQARRSVVVRGGAAFHVRPRWDAPALVVGYAHLPRSGVVEAVRAISEATRRR
jgi:GntR family transcriptional regulator/MocR family aminotransferase